MLILLSTGHRAFFRNNFPAHFTASAWVVAEAQQQVALVYHRKLQKWLQPGGHADGELDLFSVAARELEEETGIKNEAESDQIIFDIDIHSIPANPFEPQHLHYDVRYLFKTPNPTPLTPNSESETVKWFNNSELPTHEPSLTRMASMSSRNNFVTKQKSLLWRL